MKILPALFMLLVLIISQPMLAHEDHSHGPISALSAQALALDVAANLSSRDAGLGFGQLSQSWASIPDKNVSTSKKGKGYYIVSVLNDTEKKTLYILMTEGGEVYDANFTGEFEGIK